MSTKFIVGSGMQPATSTRNFHLQLPGLHLKSLPSRRRRRRRRLSSITMALGYLRLPACVLRRRCSSLVIPHKTVFDARSFSTSAALTSGHSRWSKIKHDKAVVDSRRGSAFSKVSNEISTAAKEAGGEMSNLRLQAALLAARKGAGHHHQIGQPELRAD